MLTSEIKSTRQPASGCEVLAQTQLPPTHRCKQSCAQTDKHTNTRRDLGTINKSHSHTQTRIQTHTHSGWYAAMFEPFSGENLSHFTAVTRPQLENVRRLPDLATGDTPVRSCNRPTVGVALQTRWCMRSRL